MRQNVHILPTNHKNDIDIVASAWSCIKAINKRFNEAIREHNVEKITEISQILAKYTEFNNDWLNYHDLTNQRKDFVREGYEISIRAEGLEPY